MITLRWSLLLLLSLVAAAACSGNGSPSSGDPGVALGGAGGEGTAPDPTPPGEAGSASGAGGEPQANPDANAGSPSGGGGDGGGGEPQGTAGDAQGGGGEAGAAPELGCAHSRECAASAWCNPATTACEPRDAEPVQGFDVVYDTLLGSGCAGCHYEGGEGDVDASMSGKPLWLGTPRLAFDSLVAGGLGCGDQPGQHRLCVDDPASSLVALKTLRTPATEGKPSVAFRSWSDPNLQQILRWIARGAPFDDDGPRCGNFKLDEGEACDEGPAPREHCAYGQASCTLCSAACVAVAGVGATCGDGHIDPPQETCDDGNAETETCAKEACPVCGEACRYTTGPAGKFCGNGQVDPGEQCDTGAATASCDANCTTPSCGDGTLNAAAGEECDLGAVGDLRDCSKTCRVARKVKVNGPGGGGLDWATAFPSVQAAVDEAAKVGAPVWVAKGTYAASDATPIVKLTPNLQLVGGFAGTEKSVAQRNIASNASILDGQQLSLHVVLGASGAVLDGLTIRGGNAYDTDYTDGVDDDSGGGLQAVGTQGAYAIPLRVVECTFESNRAAYDGGGIFGAAGVVVERSHFVDNHATCGGALASVIDVKDSTFNDNTAIESGGALCGGFYVRGSAFQHNTSDYQGGAVHAAHSIERCQFFDNQASEGGAIWGVSTTTKDSIFVSNSASSSSLAGGAIHLSSSITSGWIDIYESQISGSTFWKNSGVGAHIAGTAFVTCTNCLLLSTVPSYQAMVRLEGTLYLEQSTVAAPDADIPIQVSSYRDGYGSSSSKTPWVTVENSVVWVGSYFRAGAVDFLEDSCVSDSYGLSDASTITNAPLLSASPFETSDQNGDGISEYFLKPGTPCAGIAIPVFSPLTSMTTATSGCLDVAPFDAGRHYATTSTTACP